MIAAMLPAFTEPPYWMRTPSASRARVQLGEPAADRRADLLGVLRGGDLAGADRPDRLVGDDHASGLLGGDALERAVELAEGVRDLAAGLADVQRPRRRTGSG